MQYRRLAAALAAALMIGGCGGSDSGSAGRASSVDVKPSTTGSTPTTTQSSKTTTAGGGATTKADVVAKGDKACRTAKRKTNRLERVGTTADQIAALAGQTDDKLIAKYVNVLNNELGLLRRLSFARKHKQSGQERFILAALAKQRHRARVIAKEYGFKTCGSG
jgi:hypothetical protein